jgi:ribosomal protein S18 acetylase RimI-like enzyme
MNVIPFSPIESNRFNLNIYRGQLDAIDVAALQNLITTNKADILIIRLPTKSKPSHYKLGALGFNCIHADSLVTYAVHLPSHTIPIETVSDLTFELITSHNYSALKQMIPVIFAGYQNHYSSNPFLEKKKITEGYLEWALSHTNNASNKISWYVIKHGTIAGFANCSFNTAKREAQIVLNGILPEFAGQKLYTYLVRHVETHFKSAGYERLIISTQLQNYSVQKVWIREGFYLIDSHETYHINSFLSNPLAKENN